MKLVTLKKRRDFILSNKYGQKTNNKNLVITSSLDEERLFLFLEEIISLQALLANKVPINKKVQLDAIFDFIQ